MAALAEFASSVVYLVILLVFLYRLWTIVPAENRRTTPGRAVGLMFVPLWNIYWVFVLTYGLAVDLDKWLTVRGQRVRVPKGVALSAAICHATLLCPCLLYGFFGLMALPMLVLYWLFALPVIRALQTVSPEVYTNHRQDSSGGVLAPPVVSN